jgi:peptidoglycan/LPS O-acetylase OafA/YrhL
MLTASPPPVSTRGGAWDVRLAVDRGNAFDAVRLVLATLVVLEHSYFLIDNHSRRDPLSLLSGAQTNSGHFAVIMFFALSGFLVTHSLVSSRSIPHYLLKRATRIVPGFLAASTFGCLVVGPLTAPDAWLFLRQQAWGTIAATALSLKQVGVTGALPGNPLHMVHGTLWTIQYEFDCYLILALLGALGLVGSTVAGMVVYAYLAAALAFAMAAGLPAIDHGVAALLVSSPHQWPDLFPFFLAGSAFYLWRDRIPKSPALLGGSLAVLGASLFLGGAWWALLICGTYAILYICLSTSVEIAITGRHTDLSYGVYLYGWPIQQLLLFYLGQRLAPLSLFAAAIPATYIVAWISWNLIEEPCLRRVRALRGLPSSRQTICA